MAQAVAKPQQLQRLAERKVSAQLDLSTALEQAAAAHKRAAAAEYDWSAACLALAGMHRDGPDTRRRRSA